MPVPLIAAGIGAVGSIASKAIGGGGGGDVLGPDPQQLQQAYQNTQNSVGEQNAFAQAVAKQNGLLNQSQVYGQGQQLAGQIGQLAAGQGPNPALAQLQQATGQNIASQAALAAGQRGAGANAGLIARQAAMQGGNLQQQAVGQGATLQAQQQLAGIGALQQQQGLLAGIAGQQVGQQQQALNSAAATGLQQQANLGQQQSSANSANSGVNQINASNTAKANAGLVGGLGSVAGTLLGAPSAEPRKTFAHGGAVGPMSKVGQHLAGMQMKAGGKVKGKAQVSGDSSKNDTVPALLSPGEIVVPRSAAKSPEKAAAFAKAVAMRGKGKK